MTENQDLGADFNDLFGYLSLHISDHSFIVVSTNSDGEEAASFMPQQTEDFVPTQAPPEPEETTNGNFPAKKIPHIINGKNSY